MNTNTQHDVKCTADNGHVWSAANYAGVQECVLCHARRLAPARVIPIPTPISNSVRIPPPYDRCLHPSRRVEQTH